MNSSHSGKNRDPEAKRQEDNDIISANLEKRLKQKSPKFSNDETRIVAESTFCLIEALIKEYSIKGLRLMLCEKVFKTVNPAESTKRLYKCTLPSDDSTPSRISSLVKKIQTYKDIAVAIAAIMSKEKANYYYSDIFQGTRLALSPSQDENDGDDDDENIIIAPLFYDIYSALQKMSKSIIQSEELEEYYTILSKGTYNYQNIFPQHKLDDSTLITLEGSFDHNGKPVYPASEAWNYNKLIPTIDIDLESSTDCIGLINAPLVTLLGEETHLRLELIPENISDADDRCPVIINDVIVQEKVELGLVVQCFSILMGGYGRDQFNTLIQQRHGVYFNHPDIRDLFTYHDEYALVEFKGSIYRIYWSGDMLKYRQGFIPEYISPDTIREFLDINESRLQYTPHHSYKLDYLPLKSTKQVTGLLQQPFSSPYYGNVTGQVVEPTLAEKLYANLLKDPSEAGSIEGYLRQDARRKKALLMRGHDAYLEQLNETIKNVNERWAKSMK